MKIIKLNTKTNCYLTDMKIFHNTNQHNNHPLIMTQNEWNRTDIKTFSFLSFFRTAMHLYFNIWNMTIHYQKKTMEEIVDCYTWYMYDPLPLKKQNNKTDEFESETR